VRCSRLTMMTSTTWLMDLVDGDDDASLSQSQQPQRAQGKRRASSLVATTRSDRQRAVGAERDALRGQVR